MPKLTERQRSFVRHKAEGLTNEKAMIAAGYSAAGAAPNASALLRRPDIKAAIRAAKRADMTPIQRQMATQAEARGVDPDADAKNKMPKDKYVDPKEFLTDAMNNQHLGITTRAGFAAQLMPYMHARIGEKGKKDSDLDKAKAVVGGKQPKPRADGKPKFAPGKAPKLVAVK